MGHMNRGFEQELATTRRWKGVHLEKTKSRLAFPDHPVNFCQDRLRSGDVTGRRSRTHCLKLRKEEGNNVQCTTFRKAEEVGTQLL